MPDWDPTWLECNGDRYIMALHRDKKGCFFRNKRTSLCEIYEHRPLLCRLYPFRFHETRQRKYKGFSLHTDVGCPRERDNAVETKPLHDLFVKDQTNQEDYNHLVAAFNRRNGSKKSPKEFIRTFIDGNFDEKSELVEVVFKRNGKTHQKF